MKLHFHFRPTDIAAKALSVAFAAGCSLFAGYMILRLQHMENPPADLGLNFPEKSLRIDPQPVLVDPMPTKSITPASSERVPAFAPLVQPYRAETPVLGYRLLSVFDGIAFIEVTDLKGPRLQPVSVGSELQGAGEVEAIEQVAGRWQVRASGRVIATTQ
jgi:hypothetical protein